MTREGRDSLFQSLRQRKGCIVQRPGDEEPGWWLLLREGELRGVLRKLDALNLACEAALAHTRGLVMDTPEDQYVVDKLTETLAMALGMGE